MVSVGSPMKKSNFKIFFISCISSFVLLAIERSAGMGWDFHPDSVTYATDSISVASQIYESQYFSELFNNGYYVVAALLAQNILLITFMNIMLFSLTNVLIYRFVKSFSIKVPLIYILLLIFNPYRIHLSTTMLKDTMIIFFFVLCFDKTSKAVRWLAPLLMLRMISVVYFLKFLPKWLIYLLLITAVFYVSLSPESIEVLERFNSADMDFREFNTISAYKEYGLIGALLRAILWPIIAVSGFYLVMSPALLFIPLFVGAVMQIAFQKKIFGSVIPPFQLFVSMAIIALLVTGFTSYIRYIYPIIVVVPLVMLENRFLRETLHKSPSCVLGVSPV